MSIHVWLDEMFESNRKWAERDEGIGRFLTTELLKPPPFLRGSRSLVAKVPNTPRSIGDIFQVEWNIQAFVSFSLPFPPTLLSLSSIIPPYLFVSSRRYYCFFHTIYTFSYIRVRYFSSSFLPNTCTLDPRRENCSFEYADGFPLRRHTHSLSLSVSRGSIDKPFPPDSIIFSLFYFIFFFYIRSQWFHSKEKRGNSRGILTSPLFAGKSIFSVREQQPRSYTARWLILLPHPVGSVTPR